MYIMYLKGDIVVTLDSGSKRKCFWVTVPVLVFMVTTGKPICSTQVFMMLLTVSGSLVLLAMTACGTNQNMLLTTLSVVECTGGLFH